MIRQTIPSKNSFTNEVIRIYGLPPVLVGKSKEEEKSVDKFVYLEGSFISYLQKAAFPTT